MLVGGVSRLLISFCISTCLSAVLSLYDAVFGIQSNVIINECVKIIKSQFYKGITGKWPKMVIFL